MKNRLYNLDALRFIAAWVVLLVHVEVLKPIAGVAQYTAPFFKNSAQIAVTFFFVLSGFLITWLLLIEKRKHQEEKINVWRFYRKRIFRIWPLYYLVVLLGFFVLNQIPFFSWSDHTKYFAHSKQYTGLIYYLFFLPNYSWFNFGAPQYVGQVWSLGVEEFFYLYFPIAVYFISLKRIPTFLLSVSVFFIGASVFIRLTLPGSTEKLEQLLYVYADRYRLYSFALGGLAASYLLQEGSITRIKNYLSKKYISYLLLVITAVLVLMGRTFSVVTQQAYSILFSILILSILLSGIRPWILNNKIAVYLGKISYGIYMLHFIAIVAALKLFVPMLQSGVKWIDSVIIYISATIFTIILAMISWHFYEKFFLQFRIKRNKTE